MRFRQSAFVTAHEVFMAMMRDQVGPRLRELGLKGGGRSWQYPHDQCFVLLGFQRSKFGSADVAKYTINLSVYERDEWRDARLDQAHLPEMPKANLDYGAVGWCERIGRVMPDQKDRWWEISSTAPTDSLGREMLEAIEQWGLPWCFAQIRGSGSL